MNLALKSNSPAVPGVGPSSRGRAPLLPARLGRGRRIACLLAAACLLVAAPGSTASPPDPAPAAGARGKLVIPLKPGRIYDREEVRKQLCELEGKPYYPLAGRREAQLRRGELAALAAARLLGLLDYTLSGDRLEITLSRGDQGARSLAQALRADWGLALPDRGVRPEQPLIVVVHGLESNLRAMRPFGEALGAHGAQVAYFEYPNDGPVADAARRLSADLRTLRQQHRNLRICLVGHSMGGLVNRYALEMPELNPGGVTDLVTIGTPHRGSAIARGQPLLEQLLQLVPRLRRNKWTPLNDGAGEAAGDLTPGSRLLRQLEAAKRPQEIAYHVAYGTRGVFRDQAEQQAVVDDVARILQQSALRTRERDAVLAFLRAPELCSGKGDGAVTVASARLPDVANQRAFELDHLGLVKAGRRNTPQPVAQWVAEVLERE